MSKSHYFFFLAALITFVGCSNTTQGTDAGGGGTLNPTCNEIMERCHPLDTGTGEIHECHEFAENLATTEADCVAMRTHCFDVCTPVDSGTPDDAGAAVDSATDAAHAH